jgi:hypothetical protein
MTNKTKELRINNSKVYGHSWANKALCFKFFMSNGEPITYHEKTFPPKYPSSAD